MFGGKDALASAHPVLVPAHGIDFAWEVYLAFRAFNFVPIRTVVGCPSHRLSTIPAREGVRRETRVHEREMRAIQDVVEVVVIVIHLWRRQLALIHDVL